MEPMSERVLGSRSYLSATSETASNPVEIDEKDSRSVRPAENSQVEELPRPE